MLIFVRLIFVAAIDYENIFTTKISRFTVVVAVLYNIILLYMYMYMSSHAERARGEETEEATGAAARENGQPFRGRERRSEFNSTYGH